MFFKSGTMAFEKSDFSLSVALGYRDFQDPQGSTIREHKRISDEKGGVWWGWWKKEFEPDNHRHLEKLKDLSGQRSFPVGLVDRSTDEYFIAACEGVVSNIDPVPSPLRLRTPEYYSGKRCRAWFYFTGFESVDRITFVRCFTKVPKSIEATLFPIENGKMVDQDRFFHYHDFAHDKLRLLHISDIHLGDDYGFAEKASPGQVPIYERLTNDREKVLEAPPNLIVFSGDITTKSNVEVMRSQGLKFLNKICDIFKLDHDQVVIVPGNHDIPLMNYVPNDYSHEGEFRALLKDFYGSDMGTSAMHIFGRGERERIEILAMNSIRLRNVELKNFGYVQWGLYEEELRGQGIEAFDKEAKRIAVLHHHLIPVPYEDELEKDYIYASASATIDSGSVIEGLHNYNFDLALHGHQHVPGVSRISRGINNGRGELHMDSRLNIVSAGSLTSSRLANYMRNNSYNYIVETDGGYKVTSYEYTSATGPTRQLFSCCI